MHMPCRCQLKLPYRAEPVDEVDIFCVATLLCLVAAGTVFFISGSLNVEIWLPLVAAAVLFVTLARQCQRTAEARQADDAADANARHAGAA